MVIFTTFRPSVAQFFLTTINSGGGIVQHFQQRAFSKLSKKTYQKLQVVYKSTDFRAATKLVETELIDPNDHQIRVRNIWAGINATDINITAGRYHRNGTLPFDFGMEALGVVDAVGSKVPENLFKKEQPVLVVKFPNGDGFSEYIYADADELFPVPELKPEYLVSIVNGLTASIGLDKAASVKKGDKVLVTAAAGGTGQIAVQWAKHRGAYVIGLTSSDKKSQYLKSLGTDVVINYRTQDLDQTLREKFPEGIDVVWETIGGETFITLSNHLAIRGRLVMLGSTPTYKFSGMKKGVSIENIQLQLMRKSQSYVGLLYVHYQELFPEYLSDLTEKIHQKKIKARVEDGDDSGKFFGLDQVWRAEEYLHSGRNIGKVVVQIQQV